MLQRRRIVTGLLATAAVLAGGSPAAAQYGPRTDLFPSATLGPPVIASPACDGCDGDRYRTDPFGPYIDIGGPPTRHRSPYAVESFGAVRRGGIGFASLSTIGGEGCGAASVPRFDDRPSIGFVEGSVARWFDESGRGACGIGGVPWCGESWCGERACGGPEACAEREGGRGSIYWAAPFSARFPNRVTDPHRPEIDGCPDSRFLTGDNARRWFAPLGDVRLLPSLRCDDGYTGCQADLRGVVPMPPQPSSRIGSPAVEAEFGTAGGAAFAPQGARIAPAPNYPPAPDVSPRWLGPPPSPARPTAARPTAARPTAARPAPATAARPTSTTPANGSIRVFPNGSIRPVGR